MLARYLMFAGYNTWCNERLYELPRWLPTPTIAQPWRLLQVAARHPQPSPRWRPHLDAAVYGRGDVPPSLDAVLYDDFAQLRAARCVEDQLISAYVGNLREDDLTKHDSIPDRRKSARH